MTSLSELHFYDGVKISDKKVVVIPSLIGKYVAINTRSGWQAQYVNERGYRICIAVDCPDQETVLVKCKEDHIKRLQQEIRRLGG